MRMKVTAAVGSAAAVLDSPAGEVLRGAAEGLMAGARMFPKTLALDLAVHAVGVTSPEGTFLRSGAALQHSSSHAGRSPGACMQNPGGFILAFARAFRMCQRTFVTDLHRTATKDAANSTSLI